MKHTPRTRAEGEGMTTPSTTWIRTGLWALPVYGLLTIWSTFDAQPDQAVDAAAWARYVASPGYVLDHTIGAIGGAVFAILGVIALGAFLANGRSARLGLWGLVVTVVGHALGLAIGGITSYATPAIGRAYLAGLTEVMQIEFPDEMLLVFVLALLAMFVGNLLLGAAVWRSSTLPAWAGATWLAATILFYAFGAVLGMATTGSSLPTQPIGAALMVVAGASIAWSASASRSTAPRGALRSNEA
jgi:hypothetical protein